MQINNVAIIETPRDAMQGLKTFIPTHIKAQYINQLLKVGFDVIDFGSFVSPKAIPQLKDTASVLENLDMDATHTQLLAIVANLRGALDAAQFEKIRYLGYPFSISETFQLRNTNATILESLHRVEDIQDVCVKNDKQIVIYISMGFGNPYGDPWNVEICQKWVDELAHMGIKYIALSDTIGVATEESIAYLFSNLIPPYPDVEFGAHFHTRPDQSMTSIAAAYSNGCRRFDGAIRGFGGCPMAKDKLTGNMPTEHLIQYFKNSNIETGIDPQEFEESMKMALDVFPME